MDKKPPRAPHPTARALVDAWRRDGTIVRSRALPDGAVITRAEWLHAPAPPPEWLAEQNDPDRLRAGWALVPVPVLDALAELASEGLEERARRRGPRSGRPDDAHVLAVVVRAWRAGALDTTTTLEDVLALPGLPTYYAAARGRPDGASGLGARRERLRELLRLYTPVRLRVGRPRKKPPG